MSKKIKNKDVEESFGMKCELVSGEDVSYLEGRLKTFIDSIIPESQVIQNKATKDIIGVILWDWFNFITDHLTDHLFDKEEWYMQKKGQMPKKTNPINN